MICALTQINAQMCGCFNQHWTDCRIRTVLCFYWKPHRVFGLGSNVVRYISQLRAYLQFLREKKMLKKKNILVVANIFKTLGKPKFSKSFHWQSSQYHISVSSKETLLIEECPMSINAVFYFLGRQGHGVSRRFGFLKLCLDRFPGMCTSVLCTNGYGFLTAIYLTHFQCTVPQVKKND